MSIKINAACVRFADCSLDPVSLLIGMRKDRMGKRGLAKASRERG